ncbi:hypothetical protein HispidOSU_029375, partial [Sigmodon hispidus]
GKFYDLDSDYDLGGTQCPAGFLLLTVTRAGYRNSKSGKSCSSVVRTVWKETIHELSFSEFKHSRGDSAGGRKTDEDIPRFLFMEP